MPIYQIPETPAPAPLTPEQQKQQSDYLAQRLVGIKPEQSAENAAIADRLKQQYEYVRNNPQAAREELSRRNFSDAIANSPEVRRWLSGETSAADMAADDLDNLGAVARAGRKLSMWWDAAAGGIRAGWITNKQGEMWGRDEGFFDSSAHKLTDEEKSLSKAWDDEQEKLAEQYEGNWLYDAGNMGVSMAAGLWEHKAEAALIAAGAALLAPVTGGGSIGAGTALGAGLTGAMIISTRNVEGGLARKEALEAGCSAEEAEVARDVAGWTNTAIELGALKVLGKTVLKPAIKTFKAATTKAVIDVVGEGGLRKLGARQALGAAGKAWAAGMIAEPATEVLQEISTALVVEYAKIETDPSLASMSAQDLFDRVYDTAVTTLRAQAVLGMAGAGVRGASHYRMARRAKEFDGFLDAVAKSAETSKLRARAPSDFGRFVASLNGADRTIYVSGEAFNQAMADSGVSMETLEEVAGKDIADKVREADGAVDKTVAIPMGDYAAKISGTKLDEKLRPNIATEEGGLTYQETVQRQIEEQKLAAEYAKAEARIAAGGDSAVALTPEQQEIKDVRTDMERQLLATGHVSPQEAHLNAILWARSMYVLAKRSGRSLKDLYTKGSKEGGAMRFRIADEEGRSLQRDTPVDVRGGMDAIREVAQEVSDGIGGKEVSEGLRPLVGAVKGVADERGRAAFDKLLAAVTPKEGGERRTMAQRLNEAQAAWRELPESVRSAIEAALPQELQTAIADARKQGEATQEQFRTFKQEVSTALPGANAIKGGKSLPPEFERHYVSLQEAMENPEWCRLAFKSLERGFGDERRGIHGLRSLMNSDDIRGSIEAAVQRMADNLLWLYNKVPARVRARSKMWYVGAYRTTLEWEKRYGISRRQAAAIIAVFSPKTNWFINMSMAERLLDIYFSDAAKTKPNAAMKESIVAVAKTLVKPPKGMPSRPKLPASDKAKRKKQRAEWKKTPPAGEKEKEQQEATKAAWAEQDKKLAEAQAKWDAEFDLYLKPRVERLQGLTLREVLADMKPAPVGDKKARAAQDKHNKPTLEDAAIWIRAYDATFNSRHINVINPEGGNALDEQGRPVLYTPAPTPVTDKDKNPIPEESGELELDRDGNPVPLLNDDGTPVVDMVPKLDGDGNAVTDEAGNPVLVESIRYRPKYKMKQSGPLNFSFGPASPIIKALKILEQDDMQTIFDEIGTEFKVRDFYNNIYNPWNKHAATIDTHAVGAATLTVVSGETDYVEENFGSRVPNAETGQTGTFPIFFEAYKRAAEAAGVSPREMQSVTWEAIRAIFKDTEKPELKPRVDAIWDMAERGEITPEEARERVFRLAGGLRKTSWEASPWNEKIGDTYDRSQVKITPQKHAPADARLTMDVAPALMNLEQAGKWMLLTPEEQRAVMNEVLPWIVGRVAAATRTFISDLNFVRTSTPTGRPQYKMYCGIADRGDFVTVGKLLASYLKLRSVSVISPEQRGDLSRRNVIRIEVPEHWTLEQKDYLYSHWLAPLTSKDAAGVEHPVVPELFTEGRVMLIHVDPADEAAVKAQLKKAEAADGFSAPFVVDDAFAGDIRAFTDKEIESAGDNGSEGEGGVLSQVRAAGYDPNLGRECARRFRDAVESRLAARDGGLGPWANPGLPVSEWIRRLSVAYGEGEGGYDFRTEATAKWGPRAGQAIAAGRAGFVGRCLGLTYAHGEGPGPAGGDRGLEVWSPDPKLKALYEANGVSAPEFYKLSHSEEDARVFHDAIAQTRDPGKNPHFASVYVYSVEEYREMDLFMDADRTCGIAVKKDGDIVSVFKLSNCKHRRVVHSLIEVAKVAGGNHLDCYDTVLPRLYSVHGFRATVRQHWNEDYKPDGWDKNTYQGYGPAGAGDPDVVYMSYDPDYYGFYDPFSGYVIDDYDETQRIAGEGLREITAAAEDRRQARVLRQAAMDGEDAPPALPSSNELQFGARIERREFASRTPAQWIDELRDAHQVPHDAVSAEKISMMQDLLKAGSMADVRSIPVEAREHGISQEVLDWFQVVVMDPLEASQNLIEFAKADHRLPAAERELDQKYEALVRAGDIEGARQLVEQKLEAMGLSDAIPDQCRSYRIRTRSAPKKTITVYKTFTVDADGAPTTLFVGGADKIPQGVWLDALDCWHFVDPDTGRKYVPSFKNPNSDGGKTGDMHKFSVDDRQYLLDHGYITEANKSNKVTCLKYRPGWHAGDMPFFPQGGKKVAGSNHGNVHRWNQVVFMCEFAADTDFTELAQNQSKARAKSGKLHAQEADLDYIPEDGFYRYSTNPLIAGREDVFGNWMISGSMRIVRAMTQEECDSMLISHGLKPQEWEQGKLDLNALHVPEGERDESARKTVAPITYDETGKVIPLSSRFNRDSRNVLYQKADAWTPDEDLIARAKETFGVTKDPHEAFYMLPDGTMLDGSGRHRGGDERDVAGQRQVDHQDIGEVVDSSGADAMYEWMARTGAPATTKASNGPRGSFDPHANTITLTPNANLSTFSHEMGHWFFETVMDLAQQPGADPGLVADAKTLMKSLGIADFEDWKTMDRDRVEAAHETFAAWTEEYLATAKPPVPELGSIMRRLGDWICNVYRDLTGKPHVHEHLSARVKANYGFELPELSDEVRGVLGRMVAAEDEIEAANLADSTPEIFLERPAFVTDDDWAEYLAAREASLSEARDVLAGKKLEGMRWAKSAGSRVLKKMQGESRQLRRMAERDARGELMKPGTLYWHMENVRQLPRDMKPSFDEVMACIEDGQLDGILTREQAAELVKRGWLAGRGKGMPLGEFVTAFGAPDFPTFAKQYFGEALNPTLEDEVQRLADKTMEENFPLYASDQAMEDKAAEAVANEAGVRAVAAELSFLRDLEAGERESARIMNAAAEDQVGAEGEPVKTVEDFLREAKAQQKLMDAAIRRGDDAAVVEAKSQRDLAIAKARRLSKLARDTLTATKIETEAAKEAAKSAIGRLQVSEVTPKRFMNLAAKFRKQAVVAYQRGDLQIAIKAKQSQLMYQAMAKAAVDFQQRDIHHIKTMAKRFTLSDEKLKNARSIDLVNFGRAVLGRFGLVSEKRASSAEEELEKIRKYDPETARGLDAVLAGAASPAKWTELTVDDFHALSDQVDAIWDISKRTKEMEVEGRSVALADAAAQLTEQLDARFGGKRRKSVLGTDETTQMQRVMKCADHFFAGLRRVEAWCQDMDRGNPKQPFTRFIWRPMSDAVNAYNLAKRGYYSRLRDIFDRYGEEADRVPGKITADELINPETGEPFVFSDKSALIGALLHTGNASNKSKLVGGYGWGEINEETGAVDMGAWDSFVQRMIDTKVLTQRDFDFVQEIWDLLEEMKPETQKAHHRMTGMYFDEITEQPFTVTFPDGKQVTYKGGYVPAMVDKNKESRNVADEERDLSAVGQSFDFPNSGNGFTKTRAEGYKKPLILSVDMVPAHIDQVLRYTYIQPAAVEVYRLVKNEETRKTIMSYGNSEAVDGMLVPWLSRTVKQRVSIPTAEGSWRAIENATSQLRSRTGMAIMCGNLSNALQQLSGFSLSAAVIKPSFLASAAKSILFGEVTVADITALSPYMASRLDDNQVVALERAVEEFKLKATKLDKAKAFMQAHSYFLQEAFQKLVDIPTWLGAYNQALAEGYEPAEAVQRADRDVRMTQSSNAAQDVSAIETGNALQRSLMMFFNYFDMIYNLSVNEFGDAFRRREYGRMAWAYATIILLPTLISDVIKEDLLGAGDGDSGDDDDDPWIKWVTIKLLSASLRGSAGMIPGGGAVGTMIDNRLTGKPRSLSLDRLNPSPVLSSLETVSQVPADLMDAANGRKYKKAIKDGLMVISLAGYPVYQLGKPLGYMADIMEGKSELPSNPVKAAQGLVIGREPK